MLLQLMRKITIVGMIVVTRDAFFFFIIFSALKMANLERNNNLDEGIL